MADVSRDELVALLKEALTKLTAPADFRQRPNFAVNLVHRLDAALAQAQAEPERQSAPSAEPVAWRIEWDTEEGRAYHFAPGRPSADVWPKNATFTPLYAAPAATPAAVPKGFVLVPKQLPEDPGINYTSGRYSRRNWEAALEDLTAPTPPQAEAQGVREARCAWEDEGEYWQTGCGHAFTIIEGSPSDNGMKFCPYCGDPLDAAIEQQAQGGGE